MRDAKAAEIPQHRGRASALAVVAALVGIAGAACRGDGKTPALYTAIDEEPPAPGEAPPVADAGPVAEPHRDLWFARGPGRDAILARERRDYARAVELLDGLLADDGADAKATDERGAALLLRGLEDVRVGDHARAAERFAAARKAPGLKDIDARLRLLEGQALLDSAQPAEALVVLEGGPLSGALEGAGLIANADARQRTGDRQGARALYERFLGDHASAPRRHEARVKLARLLAESEDAADLQRAHDLYERLLLDVPLSDYGEEAAATIPGLVAKIGGPRSLSSELDKARARTLARLQELLARGRYKALLAEVDAFLRLRKLPKAERCEALFIRASAVFKQRKRAESRPKFEQAAAECKKAGIADTEVRARYQAGRGRYAEGHYERAAKDFEALARDYPDHSYADDALVLAGESWAELDRRDDERLAYEKAVAVRGDMAAEARRRLVVRAFVDERYEDGLRLLDDGLAAGESDPVELAKLRYYRGRALARLGRQADAEAAWVAALREAPLSYPAILALSRLRDAGDEPLARGLAVLESPPADGPAASAAELALPDVPAARRAKLLARLGLGEEARDELDAASIKGWPAAATLAQAGLYGESQRLLGAVGRGWRRTPPVGDARQLWELAHPLAFEEVIRGGEDAHQVPRLLTFAIMQTESRFDPGATSWAGARGLIQMMPGTAKDVATKAGLAGYSPDKLYDPAFNLDLGMRYLGRLVGRYGGSDEVVPLAIPSYNAGPGAVERWLTKQGTWDYDLFIESIPFDETRKYTQSVMERWMVYRWVYGGEAKGAERLPYIPMKIPARG